MTAAETAVGAGSLSIPPERVQSVRVLDALLDAALFGLVAVPTLLQSSRLTDNFLGKSGATLVMAGLVVLLWVAASVARQGTLHLRRSRADLPFVALLAISVVALVMAQNVWRGAEVLLSQVLLFAVFVVVRHRYRARPARARLVWAILLTGLVVSLLGILQYAGIHLVPLPERYGDLPISTLGNTNFVAHYLELIIPLAAALVLWGRPNWWQRLFVLAVLSSAGFHILLTENRAGWLSTGVALLLLAALSVPRRRVASTVVLVLVVGALLSPVVELALGGVRGREGSEAVYNPVGEFVDQVWERVLSSFDERNFSRSMRVLIWRDTFRLIGAHTLLGVGPGNYEFALPAYRSVPNHRAWRDLMGARANEPYFAHNEYLETWAEIGLVGLAAWVWLMGVLLWVGWGQARRLWANRETDHEGDPDALALAIGTVAALSAALVHACFSFNLQDPVAGTHFWILAGLMLAAGGGEGEPRRGQEEGQEEGQVGELKGSLAIDVKPRSPGGRCPRRLGFWVAGGVLGVLGIYAGVCILAGGYLFASYFRAHGGRGGVEATALLQRAIDWRPHEFRYLHEFGRVLLSQKRPIDAAYILDKSLALHPYDKGALRLMGRSLIFQHKGGEAVAFLQRAREVDPLYGETYNLLAAAHRLEGDVEAVVESRKQALAFRPEDPGLMMSLGLAYKEAGQLEDAAAVLTRAASIDPRSGLIQGNLGAVYLEQRQLAAAETALRRAIADDADERWRLNLALVLMAQGRLAEAEAEVARALEKAPESPQVRALAARLADSRSAESAP